MRREPICSITIAMLGILAGCRLPGMSGPVSKSLANSRQLTQQGVAAGEEGQWERAEGYLAQAVRACPSNADAHRAYAEALWNRGLRDQALAQLRDAARLDPKDTGLYVRIAEMQLALGRADLAMQAVQHALDLDPRHAAAWTIRAKTHKARHDRHQALADYHRALGHRPQDRSIQWELAELYRELEQPHRALAALQNLSESYTPGEEPQAVLYAQGLALLDLGRPEDAAEILVAAAARGQPSPELLYQLAQAQWQAGRGAEAVASVERSLAMDPAFEPSRQLLDRIQLAQLSLGVLRR